MNLYFFFLNLSLDKKKNCLSTVRIIVAYSVRAARLQESSLQHVATDESPLSVSVSKLATCQDCDCNRVHFFSPLFLWVNIEKKRREPVGLHSSCDR